MSRFLTLNVGASQAVLAEYALKGKGSLTLLAYGEVDLSAAGDAAGSLEAVLAPGLRQVMREKGIRPAPLVLSLNGQAVFPRFAKFPAVSNDRLDELVRYEVEQNVPFPIDEIVCDHQFTGVTPEGEKAAMIVAAKLDQVTAVTDAVRAAGLTPCVVDVAPMAVYNVFKWLNAGDTGCSIILDMGARTTSLILAENEKIYNRAIPVAGNTLTKELAQTFGCDLAEAEDFKRTRGYVSLGGVTEDADETADRAAKVIRAGLTRLHAEISRSVNFYRSQQGGAAPTKLFLTGGTARLPQLDAFFQETLQVEVVYLNPFSRIALGPKIDRATFQDAAFSMGESAGLALRMAEQAAIKINLMPPELVEAARSRKRIPFVAAGALAFLASLGVGVVLESGRAERVRAEVECVEQRNNTLRKFDAKLKSALLDAHNERERSELCQKLLRSRSDALRYVMAVRKSLLPGMWITAWEPTKENDGVRVTIRGWKDTLSAAEARRSTGHRTTSAEAVQRAIVRSGIAAEDSVKIVAQKDVKDCLAEFAVAFTFAPAPTVLENEAVENKKKGNH